MKAEKKGKNEKDQTFRKNEVGQILEEKMKFDEIKE